MGEFKMSVSKSKKKILIIAGAAVIAAVAALSVILAIVCAPKGGYRFIKINGFSGEVSVLRSSNSISAFKDMQLQSEDTVNVYGESSLELLCDDDKHICAESHTSLSIRSAGTPDSGYIDISLNYGKALFTIDNKLSESSSFSVKTPNATFSVRGTSFSVFYNISTLVTTLEVFDGTVEARYGDTVAMYTAGSTINIDSDGNLQAEALDSGIGSVLSLDRYFKTKNNKISLEDVYYSAYINADSYDERERFASYDITADDNPVGRTLYEICENYIKPHNEDISDYFINNRDAAFEDMKNGVNVFSKYITDVAEWFPETIVLYGENQNYTFRISNVNMTLTQGNYKPNEPIENPDEFFPSDYYFDGEYYHYVSSVTFDFRGRIE